MTDSPCDEALGLFISDDADHSDFVFFGSEAIGLAWLVLATISIIVSGCCVQPTIWKRDAPPGATSSLYAFNSTSTDGSNPMLRQGAQQQQATQEQSAPRRTDEMDASDIDLDVCFVCTPWRIVALTVSLLFVLRFLFFGYIFYEKERNEGEEECGGDVQTAFYTVYNLYWPVFMIVLVVSKGFLNASGGPTSVALGRAQVASSRSNDLESQAIPQPGEVGPHRRVEFYVILFNVVAFLIVLVSEAVYENVLTDVQGAVAVGVALGTTVLCFVESLLVYKGTMKDSSSYLRAAQRAAIRAALITFSLLILTLGFSFGMLVYADEYESTVAALNELRDDSLFEYAFAVQAGLELLASAALIELMRTARISYVIKAYEAPALLPSSPARSRPRTSAVVRFDSHGSGRSFTAVGEAKSGAYAEMTNSGRYAPSEPTLEEAHIRPSEVSDVDVGDPYQVYPGAAQHALQQPEAGYKYDGQRAHHTMTSGDSAELANDFSTFANPLFKDTKRESSNSDTTSPSAVEREVRFFQTLKEKQEQSQMIRQQEEESLGAEDQARLEEERRVEEEHRAKQQRHLKRIAAGNANSSASRLLSPGRRSRGGKSPPPPPPGGPGSEDEA